MKSRKEMLKDELGHECFKIKETGDEKLVMLEDAKGFLRIWLPKEHLESFLKKVKGV
jgi:hypothetical protein